MSDTPKTNAPTWAFIGVDLNKPYGVYVNGEVVAIYEYYEDAEDHYKQLLAAMNCQLTKPQRPYPAYN